MRKRFAGFLVLGVVLSLPLTAQRPPQPGTQCCSPAPTVIKFMTNQTVPAQSGFSIGPYQKVDGYAYINIFVQFSQVTATEQPVDLGIMFAFDGGGVMGTRRFVTLESNVPVPQTPWLVAVSGADSWHGSPHNKSSYAARTPIMGPYVQAIVYNSETFERTVSVWGYLTP